MFQRSHLIAGADDAASSNVRPGLAGYEIVPLDVIDCHHSRGAVDGQGPRKAGAVMGLTLRVLNGVSFVVTRGSAHMVFAANM